MKLGMQLRQGTVDRLRLACMQDASIIVHAKDLGTATGTPQSYLEDLGLTQADLKRLEACGFAKRGYTKNVWLGGETLPNGKTVKEGQKFVGNGSRKRWVLIVDEELESK